MLLPTDPAVLTGDGVLLRGFTAADVDALLAVSSDRDNQRWSPVPSDRAGVIDWMKRRNDWSTGDHASWAVSAADGRLAGSVSLHHLDRDQLDAEIGYWLAPWARGRGLGRRGVALATEHAFGQWGLHRMHLFHAVDNVPSCRLAEAAGFRLEGHLRQSYRYPDGEFHDEHLHGRLATDPPLTDAR